MCDYMFSTDIFFKMTTWKYSLINNNKKKARKNMNVWHTASYLELFKFCGVMEEVLFSPLTDYQVRIWYQ